nr:MAG TPA: hypothetical protein [Caudoviricetes sp.]
MFIALLALSVRCKDSRIISRRTYKVRPIFESNSNSIRCDFG